MEFKYVIDPNAEEPEMLIDSHVGPDEITADGVLIKGVDGAQWARELMALDAMGKRRIKVYINSPGGLVTDGYSICSAMLHSKCMVDTYCRGLACSIAAVAFMCGRKRYMADYGILMFHDPYGGEDQDALMKMKDSLATVISQRSGLSPVTVSAIMAKTTWLDVSEAIELNIANEIEVTSEINLGRLAPIRNDAKSFWKVSQSIFNSAISKPEKPIIQKQTQTINRDMTDFKVINNRLGLMDEANESSRLKAIELIENRAVSAENKVADKEKALKDMEDKMNKIKSEMEEEAKKQKEAYDALNGEYIKMKTDIEASNEAKLEAEKAEKKEKAKNLVDEAVKAGKIANNAETIEKWMNKAEIDFADIKDLLDTMGTNAKGPDFSKVADNGKVSITGKFADDREANNTANDLIAKIKAEKAGRK